MRGDRIASTLFVLFGLAVAGGVPVAPAQSTVEMGVDSRFQSSESSQRSSLLEILARGTTVRTSGEAPLTLILARVSRGRLVERSETAGFRIDPEAAERAIVLGSLVSQRQMGTLDALRPVARETGRYFVTAARPVDAAEIAERTGMSFMAVLEESFGERSIGGGYGGGYGGPVGGGAARDSGYGGGGIAWDEGNYLVVAVVPADARLRARSTVAPLIILY
jgi:hypothetical protein